MLLFSIKYFFSLWAKHNSEKKEQREWIFSLDCDSPCEAAGQPLLHRSLVIPPGFLLSIKQDPDSYCHTHLLDIIVCSIVEMCWWCLQLRECPCEQMDVKIRDGVTKPQQIYLWMVFPEFQKSFFFSPVSGSSKGEAGGSSTLIECTVPQIQTTSERMWNDNQGSWVRQESSDWHWILGTGWQPAEHRPAVPR